MAFQISFECLLRVVFLWYWLLDPKLCSHQGDRKREPFGQSSPRRFPALARHQWQVAMQTKTIKYAWQWAKAQHWSCSIDSIIYVRTRTTNYAKVNIQDTDLEHHGKTPFVRNEQWHQDGGGGFSKCWTFNVCTSQNCTGDKYDNWNLSEITKFFSLSECPSHSLS